MALLRIELEQGRITGDNLTDTGEALTVTYNLIRITHVPSGKTFMYDIAHPLT
jgi:hypothetical protein